MPPFPSGKLSIYPSEFPQLKLIQYQPGLDIIITMACRRVFLQLPRSQAIWSRSASGQTTGVDYPQPKNDLQVKTHTGQVNNWTFPHDYETKPFKIRPTHIPFSQYARCDCFILKTYTLHNYQLNPYFRLSRTTETCVSRTPLAM